jgi:PncC family amidohydrolase
VSHRITNVPGSSLYFLGGVVSYSNATKIAQLGVRRETLERFGAVSKETVLEMARGVRRALKADIGIAVSGIAGPGGGMAGKPVGFTWIGLSARGANQARQYTWPGDRLAVKEQSAQAVLQLLFDYLGSV